MRNLFAMAAMAAVFCTGSAAFAATTECEKDDECVAATPVCDVAKVCRARTPAEERVVLDKEARAAAKENVKAAETALAAATAECAGDVTKCDSPTATPIKAAEQRLAAAKEEARKAAGVAALPAQCKDTEHFTCSVEWTKGKCPGSKQILWCSGTLAEINSKPKSSAPGASQQEELQQIKSRLDAHGKRISGLEGGQVALADELEQTGTRADEAYAAASSGGGTDEQADAASSGGAPAAEGSAGDVDEDRLAGCVRHKSRFLKRDKRLPDDNARTAAAQSWCLASLK